MSPRPAPSRAVADEGASIATVEGIAGRVQADHARPGVRRAPWQAEVNYLFGLESALFNSASSLRALSQPLRQFRKNNTNTARLFEASSRSCNPSLRAE